MTPTTAVQKVAKKRVFDLDKFERVSVERAYTVPADLTDTKQLATFDPAELLKLVNIAQKREALKAAKASIPGASPKVVNQMVNVFRMLPPYSDLVKSDGDSEGRKAQTQAIYTFIRSNESILQSLKDAAARASEEDDEDENDEDAK